MTASSTPDVDPVFEGRVRALLDLIEEQLLIVARGQSSMVTEAAQHIIAAGGKRFRPMLVVLSALLGEPRNDEDLVKAALVMELTHVASLYHDDVMDEAEIRRGADSANARWDNTVAILVGDFLFARASDLVADLGPEYVHIQARTFARLVQGQIAETVGPDEGVDQLKHYLDVVADKTGSLIAASAVFGGMIAGLSPAEVDALSAYGEELGVVFQLSDDIIDITSDVTGKTPGTDLREGVSTLPTLLLQRSSDPADVVLRERIAGDLSSDEDLAAVLTELRAHPVIDRARAEVSRRAEVARSYLNVLPAGQARDALSQLCDTVVTRSA